MFRAPFNTYFVCNTSNCVTVRPVRDHLTPKMNIDFFIRNLMLNIFFYSTIFSKKAVFSEKTAKNCFGGAFDNSLGKEGVLRQKLTKLFYNKWGIEYFIIYQFFPKMCNFLRKRLKAVCGAQVSFEGKEGSGTRMNITFFMGNEVLNILWLTIFLKKAIFLETMGKKFWTDMTIF